jgi:hypothetical protein
MDTPNPFQPPIANLNAPAPRTGNASNEVPASVVAILSETRPWLRLMLGLFVTGLALMVVAIVGLGFMGWFLPHGSRSAISLAMLVPLVLVILIYGPPAIFLARCAAGIRRLQEGGGLPDLEDALRNQKSLWKYLGLLILALIVLYALLLLGARSGLWIPR